MHNVSQIIARNLSRRADCRSALWINPQRDDTWSRAQKSCETMTLLCQDHGDYCYLRHAGAEAEFAAFPEPGTREYDWIIINQPRQKALLRMLLDCAAGLLAEDGVLWLAGENKAGIKSADKILRNFFGRVRKVDNARHCTLFEAGGVAPDHGFRPAAYRREWALNCHPREVAIVSYPGVFAHGRLDAGTALLLETLAGLDLQGDVLDFACGAGVVGACIAAGKENTRLTMLDVNALALRASEETLAMNRLDARVLASDGLSGVEGSYDVVVSNPPIHAGVRTDSRMSIRLLDSVHEYIRPGGQLIMVANVHLPYEKWLSQLFRHCHELASDNNYKVILSEK